MLTGQYTICSSPNSSRLESEICRALVSGQLSQSTINAKRQESIETGKKETETKRVYAFFANVSVSATNLFLVCSEILVPQYQLHFNSTMA